MNLNRQQRRQQERLAKKRIGVSDNPVNYDKHEIVPVPINTTINDYKHNGMRFIALGFTVPNCSFTASLAVDDAVKYAESIIKVAKKQVGDEIERSGSGLVIARGLPDE